MMNHHRFALLPLLALLSPTSFQLIQPCSSLTFTSTLSSIKSNYNNIHAHSHPKRKRYASSSSSLQMALTPIGPFCPFRSSASLSIEPSMESLNTATPEFATEMARIQLDMTMNIPPDPDRLKKVASGIDDAVSSWEALLNQLKSSGDFQTLEYEVLTQTHLAKFGQSSEDIVKMMRWQSGVMRAMADNLPPPLPPPDLDLMKMMNEAKKQQQQQQQQEGGGGAGGGSSGAPSISAMAAAEKITTTPFTGNEPAFESPTVQAEYEALCRDHNSLIQLGSTYKQFDPLGKISFLQQIEEIEERWDVFFARFKLLGQLNGEFVRQCNLFLQSMNLSEEDFKMLLKETHEVMKRDAERERDLLL